ncbi:hypothetical protein Rcae01_00013 [Novipirellula caenicola]|uniref:Uncharacterized protein n=1 Tax=Novipirellula caenicola TaxID=1536901 RepID=A0ABP9VH77_9BACT
MAASIDRAWLQSAFRPVGAPPSRKPLGSTSEASVSECDDKMLHDHNRELHLVRQRSNESQINESHAANCDHLNDHRPRQVIVPLKTPGIGDVGAIQCHLVLPGV